MVFLPWFREVSSGSTGRSNLLAQAPLPCLLDCDFFSHDRVELTNVNLFSTSGGHLAYRLDPKPVDRRQM